MRTLLVVMSLAGCAEESISGCETGPEPVAEVGKGELVWSDSDADQGRTLLVHGTQGGFHTYVSLRAAHLDEGPWSLELSGSLDDEVLAEGVLERSDVACDVEADRLQIIGTWLIWESTPEVLHRQVVRIDARVTDAKGRTVEASAEQRIWDQEFWEP